jgi:hypothetical protein
MGAGRTEPARPGNACSPTWGSRPSLHQRQQATPVSHRDGIIALAPDVTVDLSQLSGRLNRAGVADVSVTVLRQDVLPDWRRSG